MSKNSNHNTDVKGGLPPSTNQPLHKSSNGKKIERGIISANGMSSNLQMRVVSNGIGCNHSGKSTDSTSDRINKFLKKNDGISDNIHHVDDPKLKKPRALLFGRSAPSYTSRTVSSTVDSSAYEHPPKSKHYCSKMKNYPSSEIKIGTAHHYVYRVSSNNISTSCCSPKFANHSSSQLSYRGNHHTTSAAQHTRPPSRKEDVTLTIARKSLGQRNIVPKIASINFSPLRAPQSIVDVRHPLVTEARTKHIDSTLSNMRSNLDSLQSGMKELYAGQAFHGYGTSSIAGIPSIQSLGNVTASISSYVRTDSYGQPTVANVLFPETAQFPQSPPFGATQVGQLNQYPTYNPSSYATTPVNSVLTQYSADNSIAYPQYESPPRFVQTNHYTTSDITNSHYQYQAAGVGQIQESPLFLQSVQSPIAVTDQYAASNYARAVRTDLLPRLHRPRRFNK